MKIGIVLSKPPSYSETFFNSKIKGLLDHGINVQLFVQKDDPKFNICKVRKAPKIYQNNLLLGVQFLRIMCSILPYLGRVNRFITLEKQSERRPSQIFKNIMTNAHLLKADVDWLHFGFATMALQSENAAKAINAKMAVSLRGFDICIYPLKQPQCYDLLWKRIDKLHVISNDLLELAYKYGLSKNVCYQKITPAIDTSIFRNTKEKTYYKPWELTTVARLHWKKGLLPTLEALAILKEEGVCFNFQIIGAGLQYEELTFAIHQLNLKEEVTLLGKQNQESVIGRLSQTHIYLQYSYSEGFCNAVLEAQAMGCLCVVSNAEGLSENVLHLKTGIVVPKNNLKLLAKELKKILAWELEKKQNVILSAQKRIAQEFNLKIQAQKFKEFYE